LGADVTPSGIHREREDDMNRDIMEGEWQVHEFEKNQHAEV
jgi:hypothetical protein